MRRFNSRYPLVYHCLTRQLHYVPDSIVISSAVRTPWVQQLNQRYPSATTSHLCSLVVEASVKQSSAPLEKIQRIFVAEEPLDLTDAADKLRRGELMKKAQRITVAQRNNGVAQSLIKGMDGLMENESEIIVVAGVKVDSEALHKNLSVFSNNVTLKEELAGEYMAFCKELNLKAFKEGTIDAELIPLKLIKYVGSKKQIVEIAKDDILEHNEKYLDGAAALVMTTPTNAKKYNLRPLAIVKEFITKDAQNIDELKTAQNVIHAITQKSSVPIIKIKQWLFNTNCSLILDLQKHFQIPWENINPYGCISSPAKYEHDHFLSSLSHLAHTLKDNSYGCVVSSNGSNSMALLLRKLPSAAASEYAIPHLTLFTRDPCDLCDILLEELQLHFNGEYNLKKVFIDTKENIRYLRLYRHDIPVLHLNGQFLCMHRLNVKLLRRKLDRLKELRDIFKVNCVFLVLILINFNFCILS